MSGTCVADEKKLGHAWARKTVKAVLGSRTWLTEIVEELRRSISARPIIGSGMPIASVIAPPQTVRARDAWEAMFQWP